MGDGGTVESDAEANPAADEDDPKAVNVACDKDVNPLIFHAEGADRLELVAGTTFDDVDDVFDGKFEFIVAGSFDELYGASFEPSAVPVPFNISISDSADADRDEDDAPKDSIICDEELEPLANTLGEGVHPLSSSMLSMEGRPQDVSASSQSPSVRTLSKLLRSLL